MQIPRKYIKPAFKKIRNPFKKVKIFLKQKAGWLGHPKILPYKGYGNNNDMYVNGIVMEDKGLEKPKKKQNLWQNILAMIKRFSGDELAGVRVKATFLGVTQIAETDEKGYFSFYFDIRKKEIDKTWNFIHFELLDTVIEDQFPVQATGEVMIISQQQQRIIISDIDDTVLISHSTQMLRKLRLMLSKNALTRLPFPGVVKFYQALAKGEKLQENHPFFFVSSSEWNLYDLLDDFFSFNQIPKGVLLLRKLNHSVYKFWKSGGGDHKHKYWEIRWLLEFYPDQKFILIGDSGQQDPSIYTQIAEEYPGRVETIYIRRIRSKTFNKNIHFITKLKDTGTDYIETEDTYEAAKHASKKGYINVRQLYE